LNGRTAFCVVRNHWDAVVSWWFNFAHQAGRPFNARWLRGFIHGHPDYFKEEGLWWFIYLEPQPRILRYENLLHDLNALLDEFGLRQLRKLEEVGISKPRQKRHYREFHDEQTAALVREMWGDEIDRLGYVY
jgi:hypothetical protein